MGAAKWLVQPARGFTDDRDVPAHGIHNQGIGLPVRSPVAVYPAMRRQQSRMCIK
jgi:hypothetical protein